MAASDTLVTKMNTIDILRLLEHFGVRENEVSYGNDSIIFPTICHNELVNNPSHKLYYYESSKRFYCYTNCKAMNVFEFIINVYQARGIKVSFSQAYTLLDGIVRNRMKFGFAVITNPTAPKGKKIDKNWENQLTVYNPHVLECFTQQPRYLAPWLSENIDYDILQEFGVRYDMIRNRIVFPVLDHTGRLVGIKVRNFNQEDIDGHRKYMPLWHNQELYSYPKMMVLYGLYQNKKNIKATKEAIVFESEKSVLLYGSYFTRNRAVAIGGSSFSIYHGLILKQLGVEKITLALDNDWDEDGDKNYGLKKMLKEGFKIKDLGFDVDIVYDWEHNFLGNKDAPIDKGRAIFAKIYRDRRNINNFQREEEDGTDEVPTEDENQL